MTRYVTGTEPRTTPEKPRERTEQQSRGVSGTTHSISKTTPQEASERIAAMKESLKN
jgi:hypothetical protein